MSYGQLNFETNQPPPAPVCSSRQISNSEINTERSTAINDPIKDDNFQRFRFAARSRSPDDHFMLQTHEDYVTRNQSLQQDLPHKSKPELFSDDNVFDLMPNEADYQRQQQPFYDDPHDSSRDDNIFDLTPDQQLAIQELEFRRQQCDFDDDYDYAINYDQILDYDVREKLESLNAQLANEPSPPEPEHRNSKVAFKEELISLVAPAQEFDLSESDQEYPPDESTISGVSPVEITNENYFPTPALIPEGCFTLEQDYQSNKVDSSEEMTPNPRNQYRNRVEVADQLKKPVDSEDRIDILVSRGGKFQLMDQNDMIGSSNHLIDNHTAINESKQKSRPISAPSSKRNRNEVWSNPHGDSSNSSVRSDNNYRTKPLERNKSNMDVPRVDRDLLNRQKEREENRKREQLEKDRLEAENRREQNERCFNAWLQSKIKTSKEELERKKQEEDEERRQKEKIKEERRAIALEQEKVMSKSWEQNKRKEEKMKQYRIKEMKETIVVHTEVECQKAFREWMKKKRQNHQIKQKEEKQKARVTRLAMRQCRKSQNLAQAIHQANSFRYLDFYGYP